MAEPVPVVASYCATFLKPEMLHIYRQITALRRFHPVVITQKREETERFPFDDVTIVPKPATHSLRRIWFRQICDVPWTISPRETAALIRVLETRRADLLHVYFGHIAVHLLPLIEHWPKPSIVSFHGADVMVDLEKPAYRAATLRMFASVRLVLARSESLRRALVSLGCPENKIRLQRTGIPLSEIEFRPRAFPQNGQWYLLQAGRLIEKKGFRTSLRAFAEFARRYPAAVLTIAGDGQLLPELKNLAQELGVADRVTFVGFLPQPDLRAQFHRAHLFLHPSETGSDGNQEGVPNSMLEAMASGLPVFATHHGGIPEAIDHRTSGILIAERDADGLASELIAAAENPEFLAAIAQRGARAVAERFEQEAQVRQLEDYYFEVLR